MFSTRVRTLVRRQWVGLIALFLVLTGGTAQALDGSNTVFSDDIVDGEVREADVGQGAVASPELKNDSIIGADVAPNSLGPARIADGSLTGIDVANNSLTGADVDEDTLVGGPTNPTGPAGGDLAGTYPDPEIGPRAVGPDEIEINAVGPDQLSRVAINAATTEISPMGGVGTVSVACSPTSQVIGGGAAFEFPSGDITASLRGTGNDWTASGQNNGNLPQDLRVEVLCLVPQGL